MKCFRPPPTWASLALVVLGFLPALTASAEPPRALLGHTVIVESARIVLRDVHPTAPRELLAVDIGPAPHPGSKTVVSRAAVQAALRRAGADEALADGLPARQIVTRQSVELSTKMLAKRVHEEVSKTLPLGVAAGDVLGLAPLTVGVGPVAVDVRLGRLARSTPVTVSIAVGGRVVSRQSATVLLSGQPRTPTLRADLPRGTVVEPQHVTLETTTLDRLPHGTAARPADLIGKRLTQPGHTGRPIQRAALEAPPMIQRGATVRLVANARGLRISRMAVAQEDGHLGQFIRVKPTDANSIVRARVRSDAEVGLDIGAGR